MPIDFKTDIEDLQDNIADVVEDEFAFNDEELVKKAQHVVDLENEILASKKELNGIDLERMREGKKNRGQLCNDIKTLENALGRQHKGLTKLTKGDLEQYLVDLLEIASKNIQNDYITETTENINVQGSDAVKNNMHDLKQKIREVNIKREQQKLESEHNRVVSEFEEVNGAEFLYRANFLLLYGLERISCAFEDDLGTNLNGAVEQMEVDKQNILLPIFIKIYRENCEVIKQYASPTLELLFYNVSLLGTQAAANFKKKQPTK